MANFHSWKNMLFVDILQNIWVMWHVTSSLVSRHQWSVDKENPWRHQSSLDKEHFCKVYVGWIIISGDMGEGHFCSHPSRNRGTKDSRTNRVKSYKKYPWRYFVCLHVFATFLAILHLWSKTLKNCCVGFIF